METNEAINVLEKETSHITNCRKYMSDFEQKKEYTDLLKALQLAIDALKREEGKENDA